MHGGVHLTVWNSHFPTEDETPAWETAGIVLMAVLPCGVRTILARHVFQKNDNGDDTGRPVSSPGELR